MQRGDRMKQSVVFSHLNRDIGTKRGRAEILLPRDGRAHAIGRFPRYPYKLLHANQMNVKRV